MAEALRSNELFQLLNTRNNSLMEIVHDLVQAVAPGEAGAGALSPELAAKLNAMREAPMSNTPGFKEKHGRKKVAAVLSTE